MTRPTFAAVIFDLDGTLIDTERVVIEIGAGILSAMGVVDPEALLSALVGIDAETGYRRLSERAGPEFDIAGFDRDWNRAARQAFDREVPPMAGAETLLAKIAGRGLPRAVATNSRTESALRKLDQSGLIRHFDPSHVVGVDAVARAKPAPDLFAEAARRLSVAPGDCLVFEDSDTGVAAALAAGMRVVQVPDMSRPRGGGTHIVAETLLDGARLAGLIG